MRTPKLYVDLDGVLADFIGSAARFLNFPAPEQHQTEFATLLNSPSGWQRLKREFPTFWMDLDEMPHAQALWRKVSPWHPSILTALPASWPSAAIGKQIWVKQHLPKFGYHPSQQIHTVLRKDKRKFARQPDGAANILIDDLDQNIREWRDAGGISILDQDGAASVTAVAGVINSLIHK